MEAGKVSELQSETTEETREQIIERLYTDKITAELGENDHTEVYGELIGVKGKWELILLELNVPKGEVDGIGLNRHYKVDMCLLDGLMYWLRGNTKSRVNWESILKALKSVKVQENNFAKDIARKFDLAIIKKLQDEK